MDSVTQMELLKRRKRGRKSRSSASTFPLAVGEELQLGVVVARVGLTWRQAALVKLAGVGVVVTAAGTRVLSEGGADHESHKSN